MVDSASTTTAVHCRSLKNWSTVPSFTYELEIIS
jgi:hypothetical protein